MILFTGPSAYRDAGQALRGRRDELVAQRRAQLRALPPEARGVYERRVARAAAGLFATVAGFGLGFLALLFRSGAHWLLSPAMPLTALLLLTPLVTAAVYGSARLCARYRLRRALERAVGPTGDVIADLSRLERADPSRLLTEMARHHERRSAALPMGGVALLAPLLLHLLVWATFQSVSKAQLAEFDAWMALSYLLVGHCHLVLFFLCWRHAARLRAMRTADLARRASDGWPALGWTVASSLIPGVFVLLIPTLLVGATGLVLVPALFDVASRRLAAERLALGE